MLSLQNAYLIDVCYFIQMSQSVVNVKKPKNRRLLKSSFLSQSTVEIAVCILICFAVIQFRRTITSSLQVHIILTVIGTVGY